MRFRPTKCMSGHCQYAATVPCGPYQNGASSHIQNGRPTSADGPYDLITVIGRHKTACGTCGDVQPQKRRPSHACCNKREGLAAASALSRAPWASCRKPTLDGRDQQLGTLGVCSCLALGSEVNLVPASQIPNTCSMGAFTRAKLKTRAPFGCLADDLALITYW